jgi:hypothetical protein
MSLRHHVRRHAPSAGGGLSGVTGSLPGAAVVL